MRVYRISEEQLRFLKEYTKYSGGLLFEGIDDDDDFDPFDHEFNSQVPKPDVKQDCVLSISVNGNAKIDHPYFSLPAGYSCPFAQQCLSKADKDTGKVTDGKKTRFRCYAASQEALYKNTRNSRWRNFDLLKEAKTKDAMADLIVKSIQYNLKGIPTVFRIHDSGDFFNQEYFDAWLEVAEMMPATTFYAYTKALPYWVARLGQIPSNFKLNASRGGKYDKLIDEYGLKACEVVFSVEEAKQKRLKIDKDDSLAWRQDQSFGVLLHGTQPKGTEAAAALQKLRAQGLGGYSAKK